MAIFNLGGIFLITAAVFCDAPMPNCDTRPTVMSQLETKYHEKPVAIGIANNGGLIEVLTTKEGRTWTTVIALPNGMSCLVAAGTDWERYNNVVWGPKT